MHLPTIIVIPKPGDPVVQNIPAVLSTHLCCGHALLCSSTYLWCFCWRCPGPIHDHPRPSLSSCPCGLWCSSSYWSSPVPCAFLLFAQIPLLLSFPLLFHLLISHFLFPILICDVFLYRVSKWMIESFSKCFSHMLNAKDNVGAV